MGKRSYWTGVRFLATHNNQYSVPDASWAGTVSAYANQSDTYVRSLWWMNCSFLSDATLNVAGWWMATGVYFVAQFDASASLDRPDPLGYIEPHDRVAYAGMEPKRYSMPEIPPAYGVVWAGPPDGVITHTSRRKGDGVNYPLVTYGVFATDQNGMFSGVSEHGYEIRCSIYGRVLWETDF